MGVLFSSHVSTVILEDLRAAYESGEQQEFDDVWLDATEATRRVFCQQVVDRGLDGGFLQSVFPNRACAFRPQCLNGIRAPEPLTTTPRPNFTLPVGLASLDFWCWRANHQDFPYQDTRWWINQCRQLMAISTSSVRVSPSMEPTFPTFESNKGDLDVADQKTASGEEEDINSTNVPEDDIKARWCFVLQTGVWSQICYQVWCSSYVKKLQKLDHQDARLWLEILVHVMGWFGWDVTSKWFSVAENTKHAEDAIEDFEDQDLSTKDPPIGYLWPNRCLLDPNPKTDARFLQQPPEDRCRFYVELLGTLRLTRPSSDCSDQTYMEFTKHHDPIVLQALLNLRNRLQYLRDNFDSVITNLASPELVDVLLEREEWQLVFLAERDDWAVTFMMNAWKPELDRLLELAADEKMNPYQVYFKKVQEEDEEEDDEEEAEEEQEDSDPTPVPTVNIDINLQ